MSQTDVSLDVERAARSLQQGNVDAAYVALAAIVERQPANADALNLLGVALAQRGDDQAACTTLERAVILNPRHAGARVNYGNALRKLHRLDEAAESFRLALALRPDAPTAYRFGASLVEIGRHRDAVEILNQAARLRPSHAPTYLARARAARGLGNDPAALFDIEKALTLEPHNVEALTLGAVVKRLMGRREEALADIDRALAVDARDWMVLNNRGVVLDEMGRSDEALACFERSLEINPGNPDTFLNIGTALVGLKRAEDAVRKYNDVLALNPSDIAAHLAKGVVFLLTRRFDEALACFDLAAAHAPTSIIANYYRAFPLLMMGNFPDGFAAYEWRRRGDKPIVETPRFTQPELRPDEDIRGKRILLYGEQGLGDVVQYARFARSFADRGATVLLAAYPHVTRLLESLGSDIAVVPSEGPAPEFDLTYPLLSSPLILGTTVETIPAAPYLAPRTDLVERWRLRLGARAGLRVGIAWSGNPQYSGDTTRSMPFERMRALLDVPNVSVVNVQKDVRGSDEAAFAASGVSDFRAELGDLADTAALLSQLDLVVTVDTSVGHIAGAIGRPVWILLAANADWRWLTERDDSPWYPTARLFRQRVAGDWMPVLAEVKAKLAALAREQSGQ